VNKRRLEEKRREEDQVVKAKGTEFKNDGEE
jgi:hypothetical protein